jgi:hypothetical protein
MYYDNVFIDYLAKETPEDENTIQRAVQEICPLLIENPNIYKTFGVYWWAVKNALQKYSNTPGAWFMGCADDPVMRERAWHGNEYRTLLAAMYFHKRHPVCSSRHRWTDVYGVEHSYTLFDPNAECLGE